MLGRWDTNPCSKKKEAYPRNPSTVVLLLCYYIGFHGWLISSPSSFTATIVLPRLVSVRISAVAVDERELGVADVSLAAELVVESTLDYQLH